MRSRNSIEKEIGKKYGRLTVTKVFDAVKTGTKMVHRLECLCICGRFTIVRQGDLRSGRTMSCGCLKKERATRHGQRYLGEYAVYRAMRSRCQNPRHKSYARYGGAGITVHQAWIGDGGFEAFFEHVGPRPSRKHSIDRIDGTKGYAPGNVRWATAVVQQGNRRDTIRIQAGDETISLAEACRRKHLRYDAVWARLKSGWNVESALTPGDARRK